MPNRGLFQPEVFCNQPRKPSDIHEHNVDPADLEKPITDFESAVKLFDSASRLDLCYHETRAVHTFQIPLFSVKDFTDDKIIVAIEDMDENTIDSEFFIQVNDHVFVERLDKNASLGYVCSITKHCIEIVKLKWRISSPNRQIEMAYFEPNEKVFLRNKVNYAMYSARFKLLETVKTNDNIMKMLAFEEQNVKETEPEVVDDTVKMPFDTDQKRALKEMTSNAKTTFVLTGPPGTGKTAVLIEAVIKLVEQGNRVLVVTSSNIAADAFTARFLERFHDLTRVCRLMKTTRDLSTFDDKCKAVICMEKNYGRDWLENYAIVISTLGMFYKLREMSDTSFSHVFIEEAGEASELNVWMLLADFGREKDTRLILCGDTTLPGPQFDVETLNQQKCAYKKSMLQRLTEYPQFKNDPRLMVRLSKNYRSHKSIVDAMSALFDQTITASGSYDDAFDISAIVPQASSRAIFCNVKTDEQEMHRVKEYLTKLQTLFSDLDIGLIAPHKSQAAIIKQSLDAESRIMTDVVHRFRGSERRAVLISCTLDYDKTGHLKTDPEWLNMAISRAQSLVIVVGRLASLEMLPQGEYSFLSNH